MDKKQIKKVFLVHGEYETQLRYKTTLEQNLYTNIEIPEPGQEYEL
jgi:metallo-beta-lactamase family protein